jgi:hypothetical protein
MLLLDISLFNGDTRMIHQRLVNSALESRRKIVENYAISFSPLLASTTKKTEICGFGGKVLSIPENFFFVKRVDIEQEW